MMKDTEDPRLAHDDGRVAAVKSKLVSRDELERLVQTFKIFGDASRLKIVNALIEEELCVHEIAALMEMSQPAVSQHLRLLKQAHVVNSRREGKHIYYSLKDEHVIQIFRICQTHLREG